MLTITDTVADTDLYRMPGADYAHLPEREPPSSIYLEVTFRVPEGYTSSCKAYREPDGTWHFAEVDGVTGDDVVLWRIWPGAESFRSRGG